MEDAEPRKKRALILEDEPAIGRVCQRILTAEGFEADIATSGLIALAMVSQKIYDVCLSDIKMPVMGGIEFYSRLKKDRNALAQKTIFTSGDIMGSNTDEFLREVKRPFLVKPFTSDELKKAVREVVVAPAPRVGVLPVETLGGEGGI